MLMPLGYRWLIDQYHLPARPLAADACVDTSVKGRETRRHGDLETQVFEAKYEPNPTLVAHLQFALRYEGVNLEVLALLFERAGEGELNEWLAATPDSMYARRAGYLFEWLTGRRLKPRVGSRRTYVKLLDTSQQFGPETGPRDSRYRVIDNVPGTRDFCPLVRRTEYLVRMVESDLRARVHAKLASYDASMLHRAAAFLYLKETQSSFEIEREKPSANRAQRFADLLRQADLSVPLTEERLVELQNAVVDPRFHEFSCGGSRTGSARTSATASRSISCRRVRPMCRA
ncbi:MAG: hypothetical protein U5K38_10710 [Woeseiaceae bacterium]|nr:hypothetical protein [Woeseiaceae bacterium]